MGWLSSAHKRLKNNLKNPKEVLKQVINPAASTFQIASGSNMLYDPLNLSGANPNDNIISDIRGNQASQTPTALTADSLRQPKFMGDVGAPVSQSASRGMMNPSGRPSWWPAPQGQAPAGGATPVGAPAASPVGAPAASPTGMQAKPNAMPAYNQALINQLRARSANAMLPSSGAPSAPLG